MDFFGDFGLQHNSVRKVSPRN